MKKVAIIILNWKRSDLTIDLIKQFKLIKAKNIFFHIILIDNHSPDKSFSRFNKVFANNPLVTLFKTETNLGFSAGVNFDLNHALEKRYDYALVINSDVKITPNFLQELIKAFKRNTKLVITGPKIYFTKGHEFHKNRYSKNQLGKVLWSAGGTIDWKNIYAQNKGIDEVDTGQYNRIDTSIDFISGCCMLINLSLLKKIGLFDDNYFMYLEDADLCTRIKRNGFKIAYIPKSVIYHHNAGSSSAGGNLQQYYLSRNRLLFAKKYANFRTKFALHRQSFITLLLGKYKWQKRGILDFYLAKFGQGSYK